MKFFLAIIIALVTFTTANAQTPATKEISRVTVSVNVTDNAQAPVAVPCEENETAAEPTAAGAANITAKLVGTNDMNLLLLRQGVKRA